MTHPITKYGQPVLEQHAEAITEFDTPELHKLVEDMFESMYAARGVGLAAPQIGIGKRIAVIDLTTGGLPQHSHVSRAGHPRAKGHRARQGRDRERVRDDRRRSSGPCISA